MTDSATVPSAPTATEDRNRLVPSRLVYHAHAFFGPSLHLEIEGDRLTFQRSRDGYFAERTDPLVVVPTIEQWSEFRHELDAIPVWSWKRGYSPTDGILDGINWEIDIRCADRRRRSSGYCEYPEDFGRFEQALARLLGLPELEGESFGPGPPL